MVTILISQYMQAHYMGEYTFEEFKKGSETLGCDSIQAWKNVVPQLRNELKNEAKFAAMYKYAFQFA